MIASITACVLAFRKSLPVTLTRIAKAFQIEPIAEQDVAADSGRESVISIASDKERLHSSFCHTMKITRYATFALCLAMVAIGAVLTRHKHMLEPQMRVVAVISWELVILTAVGALVFVTQFFAKRIARIAACLFFGIFAGIMGINFFSDALSGTKFDTVGGYLLNYGLELFFLALLLAGLFMFQMAPINARAERGAAPNERR